MKRLRYSIPDEQWKLIEELAKVFSLDTKTVLAFSTSIGLRFLDMSLVHPLAGLGGAIDERADLTAETVLADVGKAIAQGNAAKQWGPRPLPAHESNQAVSRKPASLKRK